MNSSSTISNQEKISHLWLPCKVIKNRKNPWINVWKDSDQLGKKKMMIKNGNRKGKEKEYREKYTEKWELEKRSQIKKMTAM